MECQIQIDYKILFPLNCGEIKDFYAKSTGDLVVEYTPEVLGQ